MSAQILQFKPVPEKEVEFNIAEAIGALGYNIGKMGVKFFVTTEVNNDAFVVTLWGVWKGKDFDFTQKSSLSYLHAYLPAIEELHHLVTKAAAGGNYMSGGDLTA